MAIAIFVAVFFVKLSLSLYTGPIYAADTDEYVQYADTILTGLGWLRDGNLGIAEIRPDRWRMIGYPALIAIAKSLFDETWPWAIVILQLLISSVCAALVYDLLFRAVRSIGWALFGTICLATSVSLLWDNFLLTDSLHASLIAIVFCVVVRNLRGGKAASMPQFLLIGSLLVPAFLLRDITVYIVVGILPLLGCWAWRSCRRIPRTILLSLSFCLPLLVTAALYASWNHYRSGSLYITTAARTAALVPFLRIAADDPSVLDSETPTDVVAREAFRELGVAAVRESTYGVMDHVRFVNRHLADAYKMDPVQISRAVTRRYISLVVSNPIAVLRYTGAQLWPGFVRVFFQPVYSVVAIYEVREGYVDIGGLTRFEPLWEKISTKRYLPYAPLFVMEALSRAVAIGLVLSFMMAPVVGSTALSGVRSGSERAAMLGAWLFFVYCALLFGAVHYEPRYLSGMLPAACFVATTVAREASIHVVARLRRCAILR